MSRRRGEFEHRTSIFEGAFRAWSHLGGLEPAELESKAVTELDPLSHPLEHDDRLNDSKVKEAPKNGDGTKRRLFAYEPLPRSGLAHPYVQAILSPWLGPDADHDAIQLGLTTLRTWWQHRRKGESGSAIAALGTDKMRGVVEGYTRHFFNLAHCLVVNDKEQPPRTLFTKMRDLDKARNKKNKKRVRDEEATKLAALTTDSGIDLSRDPSAPVEDPNMGSLARLHAEQRRQLAEIGGHSSIGTDINAVPLVNMKGKCVPGNVDLGGIVDQVNYHATQLAHRGTSGGTSGSSSSAPASNYGDPNTTPVVFVSENGDIQIAMTVDGITCAHCVKIVETVLRGCNGNKSPIDGLLDAAADRVLCSVLIRIDQSSNAKRIAFEAARNLAMVGYTAKVKEMSIVNAGGDKKATMDLGKLSTAFDVVANTDRKDVFDWSIPCTCPDNGILRDDCARHSQMNTRIFDAFEERERQVTEYMAGCGQKYGMPCTCGPDCRCKNCSEHCKEAQQAQQQDMYDQALQGAHMNGLPANEVAAQGMMYQIQPLPLDVGGGMLGLSPSNQQRQDGFLFPTQRNPSIVDSDPLAATRNHSMASVGPIRNSSILSYGNTYGRRMSVNSEATFGRAMSGLSALSIDWENMEDFDVNVDHSAHINNGAAQPNPVANGVAPPDHEKDGIAAGCAMMTGGVCDCGPNCVCEGCPIHDSSTPAPYAPAPYAPAPFASSPGGPRRSSLRKAPSGDSDGNPMQVSFRV